MRRNSGPKTPIIARCSLSRIRDKYPSDGAGMLGHTDVQQHKIIVKIHVERMPQVPRPSGSSTQPLGVKGRSLRRFMSMGLLAGGGGGGQGIYLAVGIEIPSSQRVFII